MPSFKVILFDLDDTLIHFDDYWEVSIKETFRQHPSTSEFAVDTLFDVYWVKNKIFEDLYHRQEITIQQFRNFRLIHTLADFGKQADEMIANDFNRLYKTISKTMMKANPLLLDLLVELQQSYSLGIVTNGTTSWQYDKVEAMGIKSFFKAGSIIISEEVGCEKPAPKIYHQALTNFQVSPEEAIFVGDSWKNDVEGPSKVGICSIWLNKRGEPVPENPKLIGVVTNILELRNYL